MNNTKTTNDERPVIFAAINRHIEQNIVAPTETKGRGARVAWGEKDAYPEYLLSLYRDVATLGSIINGAVDYVAGNEVTLNSQLFPGGKMNTKGELAVDLVRGAALDWFLFGGFAFEIIRGRNGAPVEVYNLGLEDIRTNEDVNVFWWSESWAKGGRDKRMYPAFMPELDWALLDEDARDRHAASLLYVKNSTKQVYPMPLYAQAVAACETERSIDAYHLNSIKNGFAASTFVQLCNGVPSSEIQDEVERDFKDKFTGEDNAGRVILSFSPDRQHSAVIQELKTDDFGQRYDALAKRCRQQIFTSFRANPNLFGIPTDNLGFSAEEYQQAFDLFNRTQIQPVQARIADAFDRICGATGVLSIEPFNIAGTAPAEVVD